MAATWRTVRIFVSSTFRDMHAERDHLVRFVFPRLREELLQRRIHLVDVDLRWGVTSEQDSLQVCKEIIDECRPRFLCMLGGRYGWTPPGRAESITAAEVRYGVLDQLGRHGYAFFYFRDPVATYSMVEARPGEFRETPGSPNEQKLADLKSAIIKAGLNPFVYAANWDRETKRLTGLKAFGDRVYADLKRSIDEELGRQPPEKLDEFAEENAAMEAFVEERTERFVLGSREPVLNELLAHAEGVDSNGYLCLTGEAGSGKSALLSHFYRCLLSPASGLPPSLVIPHFVGASLGSTNVHRTLRRLCHELKANCPDVTADIPDDPEKLRGAFPDFLRQACEKKRVVILLDAINQFDFTSYSGGLRWLPDELPGSARIVLSTLDGPTLEELRQRGYSPREIELKPLTTTDGEAIIWQFLQRYRKTFEPIQRAALLAKTDADTPLYLLAALEELRTLGTYEEISDRIAQLPPDTQSLFTWILTRLEDDDGFRDVSGQKVGHQLVPWFASLMGVSRHGLSQLELTNLLDKGDPQGNTAALLHLLRPYLLRRGELLDFYHSQFRLAAETKYLATGEKRQVAHKTLADFFRHHADPLGDGSWTNGNPRALRELPYHAFEAQLYDTSFAIARDERFLSAQVHSFPSEPLLPLESIQLAIRAAATIDDAAKMAEFSLCHVNQVVRRTRESPLEALRAGDLQRSWRLADVYCTEHCVLWHLLLAVILKEDGRQAGARETLVRLNEKSLPRLSESQEELAFRLLLETDDLLGERLATLPSRLLNKDLLLDLCRVFAEKGYVSLAMKMAQEIEEARMSVTHLNVAYGSSRWLASRLHNPRPTITTALALAVIAEAQAHAGDRRTAHWTISLGLRMAEGVQDPAARASALTAIARAQFQAADLGSSFQTFNQAGAMTRLIESETDRDWALCHLAKTVASTGCFASPDAIINEIHDAGVRAFALAATAVAHAQAGNFEAARGAVAQALATVAGSTDRTPSPATLQRIAMAQAQLGENYEAQQSIAQAIEATRGWRETIGEIAWSFYFMVITYAEFGDFTWARTTLEQIESEEVRASSLAQIAAAQAEAGNRNTANQTFTEAFSMIEQIENTGARVHALESITAALIRIGDHAAAYRTFARAARTAQQIESAEAMATALQAIAAAQVQAGDREAARRTRVEASYWAQRIENVTDQVSTLQAIAVAQAQAGDEEAAYHTFATAVVAAERIELQSSRIVPLLNLAKAQADAGAFGQAIATASHFGCLQPMVSAFQTIAMAQVQAGDQEGARATIAQAIGWVKSEDPRFPLLSERAEIAVVQARTGDHDGARATIAQAITMIEQQKPEERAYYLEKIATAQAQIGDRDGAHRTFTKASMMAERSNRL